MVFGAPGEIRTPDRSVRSRVLYPAELRALGLVLQELAFGLPQGPHMVLIVAQQVKLFLVRFQAQSLMHNRARGRVLDVYFLVRLDPLFDGESR